jgi:CHAT domain-containing protein
VWVFVFFFHPGFVPGSLCSAVPETRLIVPEPVFYDDNLVNESCSGEYNRLQEALGKGDSLFMKGETEKAAQQYLSGCSIAGELNLPWHQVIFNCRLGFTNYWSGNFAASEQYYNRSLELISKTEEIRDTIALLETLIFINEMNHDKVYSSVRSDRLSGLRETDPHVFGNGHRRSKYHFLKAFSYTGENRFLFFLDEMNKSEQLLHAPAANYKLWKFLIKYKQAEYYVFVHDYGTASEYLEALNSQSDSDKELKSFKLHVYYCLVDVYNRSRNYDVSYKYARKLAGMIAGKTHQVFLNYNLFIGFCYQRLGFYAEALSFYKLAEQICEKNHVGDERLARVCWFLANVSRDLNDNEAEFRYLKEAEQILQAYSAPYLKPHILKALGVYYIKRKEYEKAISVYNFMLGDLERYLSDDEYFHSRYLFLVTSDYLFFIEKRGYAFYFLSKDNDFAPEPLWKSYDEYKDALKLGIKIYNRFTYEQSKKYELPRLRYAYDNLINVGYELYKIVGDTVGQELFQFSENSKACMLKNFLSDELAKRISGIPEDLIRQSKDMQKEIDSLQYNLKYSEIPHDRQEEFYGIDRVLKKISEYNSFIDRLEEDYPRYHKLKEEERTISVDQVQEALDTDQVLLAYHYTFNAFYIFYVDKNNFEIYLAPVTTNFPDSVLEYRKLMAGMRYGDFSGSAIREFAGLSSRFYDLMISPVEEKIGGKRLVIVPDGVLTLIPFESLVRPGTDTLPRVSSFANLDYLIRRNPVSYLYSANQLLDKKETGRKRIRFAAFAPDYGQLKCGDPAQDTNGFMLRNLPGAIDEVLAIEKYYMGKAYVGKTATKARFFREAKKKDMIHLAMHAILDNEEPMNSELVFSAENDPRKQLHPYEVYAEKMSASMMVLSACNTGAGEVVKGEGVINIARAFLQAGINNVILTQWSVADHSGADLMDRYYYYLSEGHPVDIALQKAKVDFLTKGDPVKAHPYYWAGYVGVGNPVTYISGSNRWIICVFLLAVVLVIFYLLIRRKLRS